MELFTKYKNKANVIVPYLGLILVFLIFAVTTEGRFTAASNFRIILQQSMILMIAGIGTTFVMAHGNLDFSIGGEMALCALAGYFASRIYPWLAIPVCLIVGLCCSLFTGWINTSMNVPAFIAGMCIMFLGRGTAEVVYQMVPNMNTPLVLTELDTTVFYVAVILIVFVVAYILMEHTNIGKYNKAIGSNPNAAYLSGVSVAKYKRMAFMISGVCIGLCALVSMIRTGTVSNNTGSGMEINTLLANVLGGVALTGGSKVKVHNAIVGALILYMLSNGMSLWGINPYLVNVIKALVFFVCVYLTRDTNSSSLPV